MKTEKPEIKTSTPQAPEASTAKNPVVQPRLTVGEPTTLYEKEARSVADQVMQMPEKNFASKKNTAGDETNHDSPPARINEITPFIQAKASGGSPVPNTIATSIEAGRNDGAPLDGDTKSFMESRFGSDFSHVKIHTGSDAAGMNKELNAKAFTVGKDIFFNQGQYQPHTSEGRHLLAHELTHVIQQNATHSAAVIQRHGLVEGWMAELEARRKKIKSFARLGDASLSLFKNDKTGVVRGYQLSQKFKLELDNTANPDHYAFVQFIKGEVYVDKGGSKEYWPASMAIYGKKETDPFYFTDWIVDTPDVDPRFGSHHGTRPLLPVTEFEDAPGLILKGDKAALPPGHTYKIDARMGVYPWGWPIPTSIGDWEKTKPTPFKEINWGWEIIVSKDATDLEINFK